MKYNIRMPYLTYGPAPHIITNLRNCTGLFLQNVMKICFHSIKYLIIIDPFHIAILNKGSPPLI